MGKNTTLVVKVIWFSDFYRTDFMGLGIGDMKPKLVILSGIFFVFFRIKTQPCSSMRTFAMGDIHGAYKALLQCLDRSGFDYNNDWLIQLGDVTDGFNEVFECVEELLKIRHLVAIKGNHDDWFATFIQSDYHPYHWALGGKGTAWSYLKQIGKEIVIIPKVNGYKTALSADDIPERHQRFFLTQQLYYIDNHNNCFVHAGFNRHIKFTGQNPETFYWDRDLWADALFWQQRTGYSGRNNEFEMAESFKEVYIGHTPTTKWSIEKPMRAANIYNLDTGAGHSGRLTILDIDTKEFWQSDPVTSLYKENYRN